MEGYLTHHNGNNSDATTRPLHRCCFFAFYTFRCDEIPSIHTSDYF